MAIDGDITVWVSNGYAFARLEAETKAGPIIVQASAPLAAVRQRLMNEAGEFVEGVGAEMVGEAEVHRAAKSVAVGNLRRLAPYALLPPGALATYYGLRALKRRRQRPGAPPRPPERDTSDDQDGVEGIEIGASSAANQATSLALSAATQDPKVRAGMFLLRRARKDPRARRKIRAIKAHAAAGNPRAQQDQAALARAQKVRQAMAADQRSKDSGAARRLAALKVPGPPMLASRMGPSRYRGLFAAWDRGVE
jgi:hypothetical protein